MRVSRSNSTHLQPYHQQSEIKYKTARGNELKPKIASAKNYESREEKENTRQKQWFPDDRTEQMQMQISPCIFFRVHLNMFSSVNIKVLNSDYSGIAERSKKKAIANSVTIAEAITHNDFPFSNFIFYISTNYQHN